ncbi:MAG: 2,3-bisphosphoglycerate-independent phosphoglycerate mutase [Actinobacteria bacterium]|nr:2,3-bisphosphoglycerate-independent phosphoglycerate mutase [Actinomycetota bacterium]
MTARVPDAAESTGDAGAEAAPAGRRPVALIVLDGWGYAEPGPGNAISLARTPVIDGLLGHYPWVLLEASGCAVGLPEGVMGNSEVGHFTLGCGRVLFQDLSRINHAIADGSFFDNEVLGDAMTAAASTNGSVHLMGLLSDGGVHSAIEHLHALVELAKSHFVERVFVHTFMDGRDTSPNAGAVFIADLERFLAGAGLGEIATVVGRYYAMDRDFRWPRVKLAYDALVHGAGSTAGSVGSAGSAAEAVAASYEAGVTDEFIEPTITSRDPRSRVRDGDTVVFFNFRPDRARELTQAFIDDAFEGFDRGGAPPRVHFVGMTEYDAEFEIPVAFADKPPLRVLAEVLSDAGLRQLHIAETEKYAHVTFFFNGGREEPFPGETRRLIPSPTDIATYDQRPAMSAYKVAEAFKEAFETERPDFVVLNFANLDMVGHTGDLGATIEAAEHVDTCLGVVIEALAPFGARIFVTADHGNAERMINPVSGAPETAHTTNPVRLVCLEDGVTLREGAGLADVAPTVLCLLGLEVPPEMTGEPLCVPGTSAGRT